ncbi:portal protein [Rhizobium leguminosarum]|uniref:portal protein n=1 Tax=Rhizobium leguminosarum TaxID=384 RepID=UPI00293DBBFA|nr:portal protein [Rhizobium leguminosarum]MDV4166200.1 portal protein [Rhizobium leguminosarum]
MADDKSTDLLSKGRTAFERCQEAELENRAAALDDIRFSRLDDQWPETIVKQRAIEQRPCLTINKLPAFIRQVVNDARQNKPSIKVHPVDSGADPKTAEIINGLIRNIEYTSNADVAYDTAIEASVAGGFGYWRVGMDYAYDDTFDMDLSIDRVANQFAVYGDPDSMSADSSDWNVAFIVEPMRKADFKAKYGNKNNVDGHGVETDFESDAWSEAGTWLDDETVMIAEWWRREEVEREIVKCSNGYVYDKEEFENDPDIQAAVNVGALQIVGSRKTKSHKVTQVIMSGADILEKNDWPGRYIPIIPVYGDEIIVEGKRYLRSLIHSAKDAQRMFNYWRTTSTELVALAPRVPWIGRVGTFKSDADRWATANTTSHSYLEFDGEAPIRQPLDVGPAAGALQEALNASDDMKAIIGIYDASLGARSNETSGKAIMARQREGDVATFHFIDNLSRAIRHTGRILIDLIPKVYNEERVIRVLGEDGSPKSVTVNSGEPAPVIGKDGQPEADDEGNPMMALHDLTAGKYDLTVTSGPSFTTRREEAAMQMTEFVRAFPAAAPVIGDILAMNLDWPGADEIAERLKSINPALQNKGLPPEVQQMIQQGQQAIQELTQKVQALEADKSIDKFNADTKRIEVEGDLANDAAKIRQDANTKMTTHALSVAQKADQAHQSNITKANQASQAPTRQG